MIDIHEVDKHARSLPLTRSNSGGRQEDKLIYLIPAVIRSGKESGVLVAYCSLGAGGQEEHLWERTV